LTAFFELGIARFFGSLFDGQCTTVLWKSIP
jgi:hypothetical protein